MNELGMIYPVQYSKILCKMGRLLHKGEDVWLSLYTKKPVVFHKSQKSEPSKLLHQIGSRLTHSLNDCIQHSVVTVIESQPSANNKVIDTETKQLLAASTKYSATLHRTSNRRIDLHG